MKITRRKFVESVSVAAAATLGLRGAVLAQSSEPDSTKAPDVDRIASLGWAEFYQYQHTDFRFANLGTDATNLSLTALEDSRHVSKRRWASGEENFVLKFVGPARRALEQETYDVNHFALGNFRLFITPGPASGRQRTYFAVINRVLS